MKKLTAIPLLVIFLFNTIGYRFVFDMLESSADAAFTTQLNEGGYNEAELIAMHVPINMPYQVNRTGTERIDGEITINGKIYKYVKRSVHNDTLTVYCIPHHEKNILKEQANEYAGKVNDLPAGENNKKADVLKQLTADFDITLTAAVNSGQALQAVPNLYQHRVLLQQPLPVNGQPPEHAFLLLS